MGALVLGLLIAGALCIYWCWPLSGARSIGTSLLRFRFLAPVGSTPRKPVECAVHR